jgi:predicted transglutaminase-like cysteine proteinase
MQVINWMNSDKDGNFPTSYYQLAHKISQYCTIKHQLEEKDILHKLLRDEMIKILYVNNQEVVELTKKAMLQFQWQNDERWKKILANMMLISVAVLFFYVIPMFGSYLFHS